MKVIVTGASGVLGSAVKAAFEQAQADVLGLAFSRAGPGLEKLDLTDKEAVEKKFSEFKPDWVIHCAAERRPDVAEKDPAACKILNEGVPGHLSQLSKQLGFTLVYISTDYVFDGQAPPYQPSSPTNPLNLYGVTKRDGEVAVLGVEGAKTIVLRVPVLYGPAPKNSDSAVNILVDVVQDQSGKQYKMDHDATRYPTNVLDIAKFLVRLSALKKPVPSILHYSAHEPFTKYEMCLIFAKILGLPHGHIVPVTHPPPGPGTASRPRDCHLDTRETEALGVEGGLDQCLFEEWWASYLGGKKE
ncbi:NAD dependent epimerase/dehydratase [Coprinopsis cinerea okayama7|uniref:NAD dependent epimerase/dehydratase n=1 Tax=Coprinopsis cinerea (strain Okayama-7 / 130 / ATCC MYA-4618 / FGSC 9003) TaxID=240176 RepID=A8NCJ1_COPC7|nr:NAD dependent epimerase/dehydratase [Coprinopsis cinerea okayama7\|eukprot:XP_001832535.2 NAD dependent epimerase/dehydratase [Coprinopsis cinerea okayama7\